MYRLLQTINIFEEKEVKNWPKMKNETTKMGAKEILLNNFSMPRKISKYKNHVVCCG